MKRDVEFTRKLRSAFGEAPASYRQNMRAQFSRNKEAKPMKKLSASIIAAALVLVLLCGAAIAAGRLGILDMLFPNGLDESVTAQLQGQLSQTGGDLGPVRATVRDAISDGIAIHMLVAFECTDPGDVLLIEYDADPGATYPHQGSFDDGAQKWVVWHMDASVNGSPVLAGNQWRYEDEQTLLVQYVLDLTSIPADAPITVTLTPDVYAYGGDMASTGAEPITVKVRTPSMEKRTLTARLPVTFEGAGAQSAIFELTPLATYMTLTYAPLHDDSEDVDARIAVNEQWESKYANLWMHLAAGDGTPIFSMTGGRKTGGTDDVADENYIFIERQVYAAIEGTPDTLILQPYISSAPEITLDSITLNLE